MSGRVVLLVAALAALGLAAAGIAPAIGASMGVGSADACVWTEPGCDPCLGVDPKDPKDPFHPCPA